MKDVYNAAVEYLNSIYKPVLEMSTYKTRTTEYRTVNESKIMLVNNEDHKCILRLIKQYYYGYTIRFELYDYLTSMGVECDKP